MGGRVRFIPVGLAGLNTASRGEEGLEEGGTLQHGHMQHTHHTTAALQIPLAHSSGVDNLYSPSLKIHNGR